MGQRTGVKTPYLNFELDWQHCVYLAILIQRQRYGKFEHRLNAMKDIAKEQGLNDLRGKSFDELMQYWEQAKVRTKLPHHDKVSGTKKALAIWESKVTQKELVLKNVWCGRCAAACVIKDPVATIVDKSIVLNGSCATFGGKVARYIEEC